MVAVIVRQAVIDSTVKNFLKPPRGHMIAEENETQVKCGRGEI